MKKVVILLYTLSFFMLMKGIAQNIFEKEKNDIQKISELLHTSYKITSCGLNYTQASVLLGKKMFPYGLPFSGMDQPTQLTIKNIPDNATIEQAFAWWDVTGKDTTGNIIIRNPLNITDTFNGKLIGTDKVKCWGYGASAFRADVTSIISGNGNYMISGLPFDSTFNSNDANGVTLFVVYSDSTATYTGTIIINDGYVMIKNNTITQTITNLNIKEDTTATAFMLISDLENVTYPATSNIMMNNGAYKPITEDFWDFEERSTTVLTSQSTSTFGIQAPWDCCNLIMMGLYYRNTTKTDIPTITLQGDTLTASSAKKYQWIYDGIPLLNAKKQTYIAKKSGIYSVSVDYGSGCYFMSDTINITCLKNYKPTLFQTGRLFWTEDTIGLSYQWYMDSSPIFDANSSSFLALDTGYYYLLVMYNSGCKAYSDTLFTDLTFVNEKDMQENDIMIFPNPNTGEFTIKITNNSLSRHSGKHPVTNYEVEIINLLGQTIYQQTLNSKQETINSKLSEGIYFLSITIDNEAIKKKIVIY